MKLKTHQFGAMLSVRWYVIETKPPQKNLINPELYKDIYWLAKYILAWGMERTVIKNCDLVIQSPSSTIRDMPKSEILRTSIVPIRQFLAARSLWMIFFPAR